MMHSLNQAQDWCDQTSIIWAPTFDQSTNGDILAESGPTFASSEIFTPVTLFLPKEYINILSVLNSLFNKSKYRNTSSA